jgi:taurine dioxygenase
MPVLDVGPRVAARTPVGFDDRPYERFALRPLSPTIGAEVGGVDLSTPMDVELRAELRRALLEWKVLFFRDQHLTQDQHRVFALQWGDLEQHPFYRYVQPGKEQPESDVVRLSKDDISPGVENEWHQDLTWHRTPSFGAVLRAVEVPPVGGDTLWADAAAAYDALPEALQARIDGLTALHDWRHSFGLAMDPALVERLRPHFPPVEHPVVRVHPETGRKTLFVNAIFTQRIVGLPEDESDALLERLFAEYRRPEHQCRFRWEPGSVAFWDNRATVHYAASDYHPQPRVMDRISIAGDVPVGPG